MMNKYMEIARDLEKEIIDIDYSIKEYEYQIELLKAQRKVKTDRAQWLLDFVGAHEDAVG